MFFSCSKPAGQVGTEIQPEESKLQVYWSDTSTVIAYSLPDDSIRTDETTKSLLGSIMDPVFGRETAGIYSQFKLSASAPDFGPKPRKVDSLILQLLYAGDSYGDTATPLKLHVYEMLEGIDFLEDYHSNKVIPVAGQDYANYTFKPNPDDSVIIFTDSVPAVLLKLHETHPGLAEKLVNFDTVDMENSDVFVELFKGLYITTEPVNEGGSISFFDLNSHYSALVLYYRNDTMSDTAESLSFDYIVNQFTPHFNRFEHDFSYGDPEFQAQVLHRDSTLGAEKVYVQGIAGVKTIIRFPHIREWAKLGHIAINEAKLILPGYEKEPYNGAPAQLALVEIQEDGTYYPLIDEAEGPNFFDGKYNESGNNYTFRITRHIQSLINDTTRPNNGLYLFVRGESIYPERFIFNGYQPESDTASRLRLEILFTKL